jgi:wobble nucleotide-excising tRNase
MLALRKIKELKGYRFFQNFKWDESTCRLFEQNNLIYGWNGSGKTTLCDFFKDLESGAISCDDATCSLMFEDSSTKQMKMITQASLGSVPYAFKVFHQSYIQENISQDTVKHIFTVGKEQAKKLAEAKRLRATATQQEAVVKKAAAEHADLLREFDRLKTTKARTIKDAANYSNAYNKNKYYEAHRALSKKTTLTDELYQKATAAIHARPLAAVQYAFPTFIQPSVKEYICNILSQTPVNNTIDALKKDAAISNWVEQGLTLHDEKSSSICLFCGNRVSNDRFEELRNHFNKSYKELSDKIDKAIELLYDKYRQFETVKNGLPNPGLLYEEFQQQYQQYTVELFSLCDHYMAIIIKIIGVLKTKKADMINDTLTAEFLAMVDQLEFDYTAFERVAQIFVKHNKKTQDFQKSIGRAQKAIELHLVSSYADEMAAFEKKIENKKVDFEKQEAVLKQQRNQIAILDQDVRNSQIPADEINRDIAFIMGRSELVFENTDQGYRITRNGKRAKNLSKGEENAVALIYFFNTLRDMNVNAANTIVVLDDPISSFDSNFYYNAISYIREKALNVGQTFIFTHKFALLKDFSMMFKEHTNRYTIQRVLNMPQIKNEDNLIGQYHDEYAYLFKKIYDFVKKPPDDTSEYLQYPNIARRVLEGFLTFKLPDSSNLMDKVLELEQGRSTAAGRAVMRLLNNHSHLRVISNSDLADDVDSIAVLPDILNNLMEFIKYHDKRHYNTLAKLFDPQYNADGSAVEVIRFPKRKITVYTMTASAGPGDFWDTNPTVATLEVTNQECTFAVKISGDSMEPDVHDGDIVLVKRCEEVPNAHKGVVWYKGVCYCKKLVQTDKGLLLVSLNPGHTPILVEPVDEYHLFGEVVEIISYNSL